MRLPTRRLCTSGLHGHWTLPGRQIPFGLPFQVDSQIARAAFQRFTRCENGTQLSVRALRPYHLPFYIFEGELQTTYTGVLGCAPTSSHGPVTDEMEYVRKGIRCRLLPLGADAGTTTAVYAGFDFRRMYVRQALSADLTDDLVQSAVPLPQLSGMPPTVGVEAFKMKPSFACASFKGQRSCPLHPLKAGVPHPH